MGESNPRIPAASGAHDHYANGPRPNFTIDSSISTRYCDIMLTKPDLSNIRTIVKEEVQKETRPIKRDLKKIRKDLEFAVGTLDRERWTLERRFDSHTIHPPLAA